MERANGASRRSSAISFPPRHPGPESTPRTSTTTTCTSGAGHCGGCSSGRAGGGLLASSRRRATCAARASSAMRRHMREVLDELWIVDIGGTLSGPEEPRMCSRSRLLCVSPSHCGEGDRIEKIRAKVWYSRLPDGLGRAKKLELLGGLHSFGDLGCGSAARTGGRTRSCRAPAGAIPLAASEGFCAHGSTLARSGSGHGRLGRRGSWSSAGGERCWRTRTDESAFMRAVPGRSHARERTC